ncbi:MAG: amino acid-binding protein [Deltaproteobacteria bacterium RBG_13_49_15]|nr:MAG: amino acid-binding protein [Deltaproteobacteria bacterium RBG_13_49_15]
MKLKQISVSIENSPVRLYEVTKAFGDAGINLRALNLVETGGGFGLLRLLVSDVATTRRILMKKHMPAQVDEVVAVEIEDRPGSLANLLKFLLDANVHVLYTYAFVGFSSGKAVMIFRFSDNDKAIEVLKKKGINIIDAETFGILETEK